jgi:hypothetical protein
VGLNPRAQTLGAAQPAAQFKNRFLQGTPAEGAALYRSRRSTQAERVAAWLGSGAENAPAAAQGHRAPLRHP